MALSLAGRSTRHASMVGRAAFTNGFGDCARGQRAWAQPNDPQIAHRTAQRVVTFLTYMTAPPPGMAITVTGKFSRPWRVTVRPAMIPTAAPAVTSLR